MGCADQENLVIMMLGYSWFWERGKKIRWDTAHLFHPCTGPRQHEGDSPPVWIGPGHGGTSFM